jgi:translation initiation factor IF-3
MIRPIRQQQNNIKKNDNVLINEKIRTNIIRISGDNSTQEISRESALFLAKEEGKDLVLLSTTSDGVGICKIIDYQKFIYDKKKKDKEQKKKQKATQIQVKEIRMTPNIDDHDFNFKLVHAKEFLKDNNRVLISIFFKGREITYKEQGELVLLKFVDELKGFGVAENLPKLEGKRMNITVKPVKK